MPDDRHPFDPAGVAAVREAGQGGAQSHAIADVFALLADPVRTGIVDALLIVDELCVGDVERALDITPDAASYGLRVLRTANIVEVRKEGRMRFHRLVDGAASETLAALIDAAQRFSRSRHTVGSE